MGFGNRMGADGRAGAGEVNDRGGQVTGVHVTIAIGIALGPGLARAASTGEVDDRGSQVTGVHVKVTVGDVPVAT